MRGRDFLEKMELIDPAYVEAAEAAPARKQRGWVKWGAAAACLALAVLAGTWLQTANRTSPVSIGGIARDYKAVQVTGGEIGMEWPWEYKTLSEQYTTVQFDGRTYTSSGRTVPDALVGDPLGTYDVMGYDAATGQRYQMQAGVFQSGGISEEHVIAVQLGDACYPFVSDAYAPPATFGALLDEYNLEENLGFERYLVCEGYTETGSFRLADDAYIWAVLRECRDAAAVPDDAWDRGTHTYLSFTATAEALGVYKRVVYVSDDGYLWTNLLGYAALFQIGEDAAKQILSYAAENGTEAEPEPYTYTLAGTVTEISGGYVWVDDSILCRNEADGMVFKIPMADLRIRRCIDLGAIGVGDLAVVYFTGLIDTGSGNTVAGAYALAKGTLSDGGVSVPE